MAIKETKDSKNCPKFFFLTIQGGGWDHDLMKIVVNSFYPEKIERILHKAGWHSSESEILFVKNNITYSIFLDEMDGVSLRPISIDYNLEITRQFAQTIDLETQKVEKKRQQSI